MSTRMVSWRCCCLVLCIVLSSITSAGNLHAQATDTAADAKKDPAATEKPEREQTIYIPYTKLREVFEREGRGVFLPYSEFQKLWNAAKEKSVLPQPPGPPVDAVITEADNEAIVHKDVVTVSARLSIELLKKGWLQVPLRLNDVAVRSATIDGKPARVQPSPGGGYQLLVEQTAEGPRTIEVLLEYAKVIQKSPGQNSVSFAAPQAPVNRWRIRIPQAGVKVNVQPLIAASETSFTKEDVPASDKGSNEADKETDKTTEETVLLAFVGAAPEVRIDWTPKAEGATGLTALTTVQATQEVFIADGVIRSRANLRYDISRAALTELSIDVPAEYKIVNVFDANLRKWEVAPNERSQRIKIELFEPATSVQNISLELEKFQDEKAAASAIHVPTVQAIDVGRQQGVVVVQVDPALRTELTTRTGLLQLDAAELPQTLTRQPWNYAFRYAAMPFDLAFNIDKVQPRITVEQFVESYLEPERFSTDVLAVFDIADAGIFQLEFDLPEGAEVRNVFGYKHGDATPASVESFAKSSDKPNHLVVQLSKKALGKTSVALQLEQRLQDANLLTPTGSASTIDLSVPKVSQAFVTRTQGRLILSAPESLRVNPASSDGLRAISLTEGYQGFESQKANRFPTTRAISAFAFTDQPSKLSLSVERRKPYIEAQQLLKVNVESGVVRFESRIDFSILHSGVNSLRLDIPADIAADIRNPSTTLRDSPMDPQPADVAPGYVAWKLNGESELIGTQSLVLSWERKFAELEVGKSTTVQLPHLRPRNVDITWGQIVISKTEAFDVQPQPKAVSDANASANSKPPRPIDPQHDLLPKWSINNAARAFEFHEDWALDLTITRYKLEEIKHTSIERALVRMVLTRGSQTGVQALFRLRSAHQRLTVVLPANIEFDSQPVRIDGNPVGLERGTNDDFYIPLAGHDPDRAMVLEIRYTIKDDGHRLTIPQFPDDPAMQKVYLNVFLPDELMLLGSRGPWTEEWTWQAKNLFRWEPLPEQSDETLAGWITEGIAVAATPPFQRDGTMYVFSTLKPAPTPEGDLRLFIWHENSFSLLVFAVLLAVAFVWLGAPLPYKLLAVSVLVIAMVMTGVLAPTFAQQVISLPFIAGLFIVAIAWSTWYSYQGSRQIKRWLDQPRFESAPVPGQSVAPMTAPVTDAMPTASPESKSESDSKSDSDSQTRKGPSEQGGDHE